jgi:hypothetical protein
MEDFLSRNNAGNNVLERLVDPEFAAGRRYAEGDDTFTVPTASGMLLSINAVIVMGRTTVCDIMCTTTTDVEYTGGIGPPKKFAKALNVALPYRKTMSFDELFEAKTPLQQMKVVEARAKRNKVLQLERQQYLRQTHADRVEKENREKVAATRIQALFRGYRARPKDPTRRRRPRGPVVLKQQQMREFLTDLQAQLGFKPIKGLTLTGKERNSKRLNVLRNAAAYVVQRFFQMITARKYARAQMQRVRKAKILHARWTIYRCMKLSMTVLAGWRQRDRKRNAAAVTIQTQMRAFLARRRVRLLIRDRVRYRRELEAATIIKRAFRGKIDLFKFPEFDRLLEELETAVVDAEVDSLMFFVGDEIQTELERQADLELMYLEDKRSRAAAEYAEWLRQQELERLRLLELERLARLAAEEEARRLAEEAARRQQELQWMAAEEALGQEIAAEARRQDELALMRKEDAHAAKMRRVWDEERRRLAEEERLRRLREEEEARRRAALRAQYARASAEAYVRDLIDTEVAKLVRQADAEAEERRLMRVEDETSEARRGDDERLRLLRLQELEELRRLAEERARRAEAQASVDLETEVVQEELRAMFDAHNADVDAARRARDRATLHDFAVRVVDDIIRTAMLNLTEDDDARQRRALEEEARRAREREEDELRRMRLEDVLSRQVSHPSPLMLTPHVVCGPTVTDAYFTPSLSPRVRGWVRRCGISTTRCAAWSRWRAWTSPSSPSSAACTRPSRCVLWTPLLGPYLAPI